MPTSRSLRLLWVALIPVLVTPLYGQVSCNRTCPPAPNECQRSAGRSIETNQCVYTNLDGTICQNQGVNGVCAGGQCVATECAGAPPFSICDAPLGGGLVGACVDDLCVVAAPEDPCVRVGIGRINCCSEEGCSVANGAFCNDPLDEVSCDPTGVEPVDQPGQDGMCQAGTCVAQTGLCADLPCPTTEEFPCTRNFCNADTGQCDGWTPDTFPPCLAGGAQGFCQLGVCTAIPGGECNGAPCEPATSCQSAACRLTCLPDCTIEELQDPTYVCEINNRSNGAPCEGEPGVCLDGFCDFGGCVENQQCNDGNPCTVNQCSDGECDPAGAQAVADGTICAQNDDGDILGLCENGACLPNLCLDRDCSDGNSCTQDICTPPFGICSNPNEPNGTTCVGGGQCILGNCQPVIPRCQRDSDCDDGNSCTEDTCPAGLCDFDPLPNGAPCIGENGQCILGSCLGFGF